MLLGFLAGCAVSTAYLDGSFSIESDRINRGVAPLTEKTGYFNIKEAPLLGAGWDAGLDAGLDTSPSNDSGREATHGLITNVEVSTVEELINAIAPDTCITLRTGQYDVSAVYGYESPYITWQDDYYGFNEKTLVICGVDRLTLQAAPGAEAEIITPWRFAEVLSFDNCNDISLIGIKAGHTVTGDYECDDGVVGFTECSDVLIANCYLYGCGTVGINLFNCTTGLIRDTIVTDCSRAALIIDESFDIRVENCRLIDNRAYQYIVCIVDSTVILSDCEISGNKGLWGGVIEVDNISNGNSEVLIVGCVIVDNVPDNSAEEEYIFTPVSDWSGTRKANPYIGVKDCVIELGQFRDYWDGVTDLGGNVLN